VRVLITGAGGQVGRELVRRAPPAATIRALDRVALDVTDAAAIAHVLNSFQPTHILNAAAYTAVDKAESERDVAWKLNAIAPRELALAAGRLGNCRLIHISTDYVFDGESARPYLIGDTPHPLNVYGASKLDGERAVLEALPGQSAVVRTAWVYGVHGRNFVHTMLRLMRERGAVRVVADQIGTPTAAAPLADLLWALAARPGLTGLYHWTDAGIASWYDFAVAIAEDARVRGLLSSKIEITPIATEDYPTPARRPRCSVLDKRSTIAALGFAPDHWRTPLRAVLDELPNA
jgi:dTDP-4-dehydrorhamnose reductase